MATKRTKGTIQRIVDTIGDLVRQPLSDESYEVQAPASIRRSQSVTAGPRRSKAKKAKAKKTRTKTTKTKTGAAKKRRSSKKSIL